MRTSIWAFLLAATITSVSWATDNPAAKPTIKLSPRQDVSSFVQYYRPLRIALSDKAAEKLAKEPKYISAKPLYGGMAVGSGDDAQISVVVDEADGQPPRIYIDRNNDEDLTNDGDGAWSSTEGLLRLSGAVVDVPYGDRSVPYQFEFYRFTERLLDAVLYYRNAAREGTIASGGKECMIAILDENADGRFDDLTDGTLLIDLNGDGTLEGAPDSAEYHALAEPFNIHGQVWEVAALSLDGTELTLRPSTAEVAMKTYLAAGEPAPTFVGKGLDEAPLRLEEQAADAKFVLLDFWASWCGPCRLEYPVLRRVHARYKDHGLRIIGVNLDEEREAAVQAAQENGLTYSHVFDGLGWKNAVAVQYRVHGIPETYLLDKDLQIVAKGLQGEGLERKLLELLGEGDAAAAAEADNLASVPANLPAPTPALEPPTKLESSVPGLQLVARCSIAAQAEAFNAPLRSVTLSLPYVYAQSRDGRLWIFKLPDELDGDAPADLTPLGSLPAFGDGNDLNVVKGTLLATNGGKLAVHSLAQPETPQKLSNVGEEGSGGQSIVRGEGRAYLIGTGALSVFDVKRPAEPTLLAAKPLHGFAWNGCLVGNHLYVADVLISGFEGARNGIRVLDVTSPGEPREVGFAETPLGVYGLLPVRRGKNVAQMVALMGEQVQLFSLINATKPTAVGEPQSAHARTGVILSNGDQRVLLTAAEIFTIGDDGLTAAGAFPCAGNADGFPYHSARQDEYSAVVTNDYVSVFRWPAGKTAKKVAPDTNAKSGPKP
jgi:thiol-disulfide isomerase/thioredoxin